MTHITQLSSDNKDQGVWERQKPGNIIVDQSTHSPVGCVLYQLQCYHPPITISTPASALKGPQQQDISAIVLYSDNNYKIINVYCVGWLRVLVYIIRLEPFLTKMTKVLIVMTETLSRQWSYQTRLTDAYQRLWN